LGSARSRSTPSQGCRDNSRTLAAVVRAPLDLHLISQFGGDHRDDVPIDEHAVPAALNVATLVRDVRVGVDQVVREELRLREPRDAREGLHLPVSWAAREVIRVDDAVVVVRIVRSRSSDTSTQCLVAMALSGRCIRNSGRPGRPDNMLLRRSVGTWLRREDPFAQPFRQNRPSRCSSPHTSRAAPACGDGH
jgi:hypothetical protein